MNYFSHPSIFHFIQNPQSISPFIAAAQTYKEYKAKAKITDDAKLAISEYINDTFAAIKERREAIEAKLKASRCVKISLPTKNNKPKDF